ncbi:MAG: hypothetical protein NVSMB51_22200 [Solirubrobacteraceae bacterium]
MRPAAALSALTRGAARRPRACLAATLALAALLAAFALGLRPTSATDTLVPRSSAAFRATERYHHQFGDDAVVVLVREQLSTLLLTRDIGPLIGLEGCLSGVSPPAGAQFTGGARGPCAQIAAQRATHLVFGPGTFINSAAQELGTQVINQLGQEQRSEQQAGSAAYQLDRRRGRSDAEARRLEAQTKGLLRNAFTRTLTGLARDYGLNSLPSASDPGFVSRIVFDSRTREPKRRFSSLFPNANGAVIQVRLNANLSDARRAKAIELIRAAVGMSAWHLSAGDYVITGVPVIVSDLSGSLTGSLELLLLAALLVMAGVLALVFRGTPRLLPLLVAVLAAALTFGALALSGASLTMASIGVLPVLIGLAVDYAIQFQSRFHEERGEPVAALDRATRVGGPTILTAGAATAGGFLVLALPGIGSPVPMVRDFGLLLVVGVALALLCAFSAGSAALMLAGRKPARPRAVRLRELVAPSLRGAAALLVENRLARRCAAGLAGAWRALLDRSLRSPERALAIAAALALAGWALGTQTAVESDVQKLVPQSLPALRDLATLQHATHVGGEIDVLVSAPDLTQPSVVNWMTGYQQRVEARFGGQACGTAQLCPAFSLPDLFQNSPSTQADIRALLDIVPRYFAQGVISADRRTATLAFGIRLMALSQQKRVIDGMRAELRPPPGVSAQLVGLPVLAADANAQIASPWRRDAGLLAGLAAVALVLLAALRSRRRALIPLIPIALATGWSSLLLFAIRVPLNPMSVTLGALVIAISTEFSVLLAERYRQERLAGHEPRTALERSYASTGAAVIASGVTAIAGFGVLVLSDISMLRNFGLATLVDLSVSLVGVLLVLPAVLLLAERSPGLAAWRRGLLRPAT